MEIFRASRPEFEKVRDRLEAMESPGPTLMTADFFVPAASRVYRSLKEAEAEPQILRDFENICDMAGITFVFTVDSDREIAKEILKSIDASAAAMGGNRSDLLIHYMEQSPKYAENMRVIIRKAEEALRRQDEEAEIDLAIWTQYSEAIEGREDEGKK